MITQIPREENYALSKAALLNVVLKSLKIEPLRIDIMKYKYFFAAAAFLLAFAALSVSAQKTEISDAPKYDAELAKKLGGDEYGMKMYVFVLLKTCRRMVRSRARNAKPPLPDICQTWAALPTREN